MRTLFFKITFILVLLLLIGGFNVDAFGREYTTTGKIAIGQGKGTVVVEIWTVKIGSDSKDDWKETTGAQVTVSGKANDGLFSLQYRYFRFWAKSADEGYTFDAWYTNAECTENRTPNSGSDYYQTSNSCYGPTYEYYAKFIPNPYTITLDNQSATTAGTASIAVTFDANTNLTSAITKPTRTGYTFKGYYTGKNGSGVQIINQDGNVVASAAGGGKTYTDASRNWKYAGNITLYAHWTANKYEVTLKANTGSGSDQKVQATYDADMPTAGVTVHTKTGYTLTGYFDATSAGNMYYGYANSTLSSARTWNKTTATNLYAQWQANTYTIAYDANGGTGTTNSSSHTYNAAKALTTNGFSKTGYTFVGWATSKALADAGTKAYNDGQSVINLSATQGATITLYAIWNVNQYTITLDKQSGTGGTDEAKVHFNNNDFTENPIATPSRENFTFEGYYTEGNGHGVQIVDKNGAWQSGKTGYLDANGKWIKAENTTLYAYWKQNQTIAWDNITNGEEYTTGQEMGATASSGLPITYTSSKADSAYAYINENGLLVVKVPNKTITITASQVGNHLWNPVTDTIRTIITKGSVPNDYTAVKAKSIEYGNILGVSKLSGKVKASGVEIDGLLEWVEPTIQPSIGEDQPFEVRFTPENQEVYGQGITFTVNVTVTKISPKLRWNISNQLREDTKYINFVSSSNTEDVLEITSLNSDWITIAGNQLSTSIIPGTYPKSPVTNKKIRVYQEGSDNYKTLDTTIAFTIYPKAPQCLPVIVDGEDVLNNMGSQYDGTGKWCQVSGTADGEFDVKIGKVPTTYTQHVGIQLGEWNEGFAGVKWSDFLEWTNITNIIDAIFHSHLFPTDKSIELSFTGVPDSLKFSTILQTVTYFSNKTQAELGEPVWTVYQRSAEGTYSDFDSVKVSVSDANAVDFKIALDSTTRYIKIKLYSTFAGFIQHLEITQKQYICAEENESVFGSENLLQVPQKLSFSHSSIGNCKYPNDTIIVTTDTTAIYVDRDTIVANVGLDLMGKDSIWVRCNDVNVSGNVTFKSLHTDAGLVVTVRSANPSLTTTGTNIFQTGTEHAPGKDPYRALKTIDYTGCFDGSGNAFFDTLYIFGVSESAAESRTWAYDVVKDYNVPTIDTTVGNVYTPCFVYVKNTENASEYVHARTLDAANTTLNIHANNNKVGVIGYRPASATANIPAIQLNGVANKTANLYLDKTEINSTAAGIKVNGATANLYARLENKIIAGAAAVQLAGAANLTIEDNWVEKSSGIVDLRPATNYPSIDLGSAVGSVTINGSQVKLHNATHMAIAHMEGAIEKEDGSVTILDGTIDIVGADTLGLPLNTIIDGGTFNNGPAQCYTNKGKARRPWNSQGDLLARKTMAPADLDTIKWYGQKHLTPDGFAKVNPMLFDESIYVFTNDGDAKDDGNWNKGSVPPDSSDVLIKAHMVVKDTVMRFNMLAIRGEETDTVTIAPTGGLTIGELGVIGATKNNFFLRAGTKVDKDTEGKSLKGQTGFLRISPEYEGEMPEVTIEMLRLGYSNAYTQNDFSKKGYMTWQYVGCPIDYKNEKIKNVVGGWMNSWDEEAGTWVNDKATAEFKPFIGFANSQSVNADGALTKYKGKIFKSRAYDVILTCDGTTDMKGWNLLANSFAAPIEIAKMIESFPDDVTFATIYMFNTGSTENVSKDAGEAGVYKIIPMGFAGRTIEGVKYEGIIPSMQGFFVKAKAETTITLDYAKIVWGADYEANSNKPLRAPKRYQESPMFSLIVSLEADEQRDNLHIIESEEFTTGYDNGYDAHILNTGALSIFAVENEADYLAVDATNSIKGTHIGVRTSDTTSYVMSFSHLSEGKELLLLDKETNETTEINEGTEYTFFAQPNSVITDRFQIIEVEKVPEIATGVDNAKNGVKVHKFIKDNQLYILKDGVLYNAMGVIVR